MNTLRTEYGNHTISQVRMAEFLKGLRMVVAPHRRGRQ